MHSKLLLMLGLCVAASILHATDAGPARGVAPRRNLGSGKGYYGHPKKHRHDKHYRRRLAEDKAATESSDYDYGRKHDDHDHDRKHDDHDHDRKHDDYDRKDYGKKDYDEYGKGYGYGHDDYDCKGYGGGYSYGYKSYGNDYDDYGHDDYGHDDYSYGDDYYSYDKDVYDYGKGYGGYDYGYGYPDYSSYGGGFGYYPDSYSTYGYGYGYPGNFGYGYGYPGYFGYESSATDADAVTKESATVAVDDASVKPVEKEESKTPSKETKSDAANKAKSK
uniref:M96 mating-specific protein n=1 Tax=Phytophthora ramorum TaxID=164328 RepID=H3H5Q1_PHYRM